jgi:phosphoglycolate phosphatase-like HAD superfamily hydrolase
LKPVVALDFDGVICNSMDECMRVAFGGYEAWRTGAPAPLSIETSLPAGFDDFFRTYRYLVRPAEEYWLIVRAYHEGGAPLLPGEFARLSREAEPQLTEFAPIYFKTRERLRAVNLDRWLGLHHMYPEFGEGWSTLRREALCYIVTTRDLESVGRLLSMFDIDIPVERHWTKERPGGKPAAILEIANECERKPSEILFVDDHPEHLRDVSSTGASLFWASWGFWPDTDPEACDGYERLGNIAELLTKPVFVER